MRLKARFRAHRSRAVRFGHFDSGASCNLCWLEDIRAAYDIRIVCRDVLWFFFRRDYNVVTLLNNFETSQMIL